jgi:hypothetical protein
MPVKGNKLEAYVNALKVSCPALERSLLLLWKMIWAVGIQIKIINSDAMAIPLFEFKHCYSLISSCLIVCACLQ